MVVRELHDGQPADGQGVGLRPGIGVDEVRQRGGQGAGGGDGGDVARIPAVGGGVIVAQETTARLGQA